MEYLFLLILILFIGISFFWKIYSICKEVAKFEIPYGDYCYTLLEHKNGKLKTKVCPYWEYKKDDEGHYYGYCHFLKESDYILLWDQVKICGENYYD